MLSRYGRVRSTPLIVPGRPLLPRRHLLAGLTGSLVGLAGVARVGAEAAPAGDEITALFDRLNAYRRERGLAEFGRSTRLTEAAQAHADDMARHNFLSHTSSDGTDLFDRLLRYYPYNTWLGENIAAGFGSAADVLRAWQTSEWHDENLRLPEYQVVGIGLGWNEATAYRWFWTLDFGGQPDEA